LGLFGQQQPTSLGSSTSTSLRASALMSDIADEGVRATVRILTKSCEKITTSCPKLILPQPRRRRSCAAKSKPAARGRELLGSATWGCRPESYSAQKNFWSPVLTLTPANEIS